MALVPVRGRAALACMRPRLHACMHAAAGARAPLQQMLASELRQLASHHPTPSVHRTPPRAQKQVFNRVFMIVEICHQCSWFLEPLVLIPQFLVMVRRRSYGIWVGAA